jgi:hypothetical protein
LQALKSAEQESAQTLPRTVGRPYRSKTWVKLDELRGKLKPTTAFADIARIAVHDWSSNQAMAARYLHCLDHAGQRAGAAHRPRRSRADQLIEQAWKSLFDSAEAITKVGEIEALAALEKPFAALSAEVLHPLLPALKPYEEWIIVRMVRCGWRRGMRWCWKTASSPSKNIGFAMWCQAATWSRIDRKTNRIRITTCVRAR